MAGFTDIISSGNEELMKFFYKLKDENLPVDDRLENAAKKLNLRTTQVICSFGFNPHSREAPELLPILGFVTYEELARERNDIFTADIYKSLTLDNILAIYTAIRYDSENLQLMQYLLKKRLDKIEEKIETTVNSLIIDKYKAEMRAIYNEGIANIDFAEERLRKHDSGFRALLNEVSIIIESKLIPAGDIFFRDMILPEEKRKLLNKGMIPKELILSRLEDESTPPEEKKVLKEYLRQHREQQ